MIDAELKAYLEEMTETLIKSNETLLSQTKQEILEKTDSRISEAEVRIGGRFSTKEEFKSLEQRVIQLEL